MTQRAVFDYSVFTIAVAYAPTRRRRAGYVVLSAPVPYTVCIFKTLDEVARHISGNRLLPVEITGSAFTEGGAVKLLD